MSSRKTDGSFKVDPHKKMERAAVEATEAPAPDTTTVPEEPEQKKPTKRKKSDGKRVNFVLPWEVYAQWEEVAEAFGGNFSQFAIEAIKKDLKNNTDLYNDYIQKKHGIFGE